MFFKNQLKIDRITNDDFLMPKTEFLIVLVIITSKFAKAWDSFIICAKITNVKKIAIY